MFLHHAPINSRKSWQLALLVFTFIGLQMSFPAAHAAEDAPTRVARLNLIDGPVSFSPSGTDDWSLAAANRPLTIGDRVWADKNARSELHVGSTAMRLGPESSLEFLDLSDRDMQLKVTQGSFAVRVRELERDDNVEIDTPNLAFVVLEPGEYRFDVDPDRDTTTVTVRRGSGKAYGSDADNRSVPISTDRQLKFSGNDLFYSESGSAPRRDSFDRWAAERDAREDHARSTRYVSRDMTGYEDLDDNGEWREVSDYGPVWVPRVTIRAWAPYHYGHWAWVAPWGWTWVDDEPWGFAPFHYGRWAYIDDYWAWVPGPVVRRPVYAPALVGFVGGGSRSGGAQWSVSLSIGTPGVAWFPLAPGEHYHPAYTSSPTYITNINRTVVVNRTTVINRNVYINQRVPNAIAVMPASDFVRGHPAHEHRSEIREDRMRELAKMPVLASLPVAPVRQSVAGDGKMTSSLPPQRVEDRRVVGRRAAPEAPALHDELARKFAERHGTVPGTGPVFTPTARPEHGGARAERKSEQEPRDRLNTRPDADTRPRPGMPPADAKPTPATPRPPESAPPRDKEPSEVPRPPRGFDRGGKNPAERATEGMRPPQTEAPSRDANRIQPGATETRSAPNERQRDEERVRPGRRFERLPEQAPTVAPAPRPEPARPQDKPIERRTEPRPAEERRVEQPRAPTPTPMRMEPERANPRNERPPEHERPMQAAPRAEEQVQRQRQDDPERERHLRRRDEPR